MSRSLSEVIALLERLAPLGLAAEWDNVGLLVEPSLALKKPISRLFLCIDLSLAVLEEALHVGADFVLAYHPPIFGGLKRLRASSADERVVLRALEAGLAVYSPHTALDATLNGVNDWLARGVGSGRVEPLVPRVSKTAELAFKLVLFVPRSHAATLRRALAHELGVGTIGNYSECSFELEGHGSFLGNGESTPAVGQRETLEFVPEIRVEMRCPAEAVKHLARVIAAHHPYEEPAWDLYPLTNPDSSEAHAGAGAGRLLELDTPITLSDAVTRLKAHLGVTTLRVAAADRHTETASLSRVAVCAGAGGSLFDALRAVDLFVTGEMRHHDVLAKLRAGSSVILAEHSHTERGFLPEFASRIAELSEGALEVLVSTRDADPLRTL